MHADVCWNGFQFGTGEDICGLLVYVHFTDFFCIHSMFTLFCAQNLFVFDANFNSPNNQDGLFLKYQIILVSCLHVQINSIKSNKEINCTGIQNSQRYMYSVNYFTKAISNF